MAPWRRWFLSGVVLLAVLGAGCNILSLPFFILGPEPKVAPLLHGIASEEREVTALILVSQQLETRPELIHADRSLADYMTKHLRAGCQYNKERVRVISQTHVGEFKSRHPDWQKWDLVDIGKHFEADWVIYIEVERLALYDRRAQQFYKGTLEATVALVDVHNPDRESHRKPFSAEYPGDGGAVIEIGDMTALQFRMKFLEYAGEQLSWYFTAHPTAKDYAYGGSMER